MLTMFPRIFCLAGLLLASAATAGGALTNASIYTMDDEQPAASAMAWDDSGRIVFVGNEEALEKRFADIEPMDAGRSEERRVGKGCISRWYRGQRRKSQDDMT